MYQFSYAEVVEESPKDSRGRERDALERAIELLEGAENGGGDALAALSYVRKLWTILIEDLVNPENDLPQILKKDLIAVGLWVTRESDLIGTGRSSNYAGLIEVCGIIRDGLR